MGELVAILDRLRAAKLLILPMPNSSGQMNAPTAESASSETLEIRSVRKQVGDFLLKADFTVHSGERVAIQGRSGSGKTTLLRIIAGLEDFSQDIPGGEILLGGRKLTRLPTEKREIGLVFQDAALFPTLSVAENAAFGLKIRGVSRRDRLEQTMSWLRRVDLAELADAPVATLSGGEKQRVAFVRAILWKPRLLLLDEPFSALDPDARAALRSELVKLHELWPVPLILVTHDAADVQAVATRIIPYTEEDSGRIHRFGEAQTG